MYFYVICVGELLESKNRLRVIDRFVKLFIKGFGQHFQFSVYISIFFIFLYQFTYFFLFSKILMQLLSKNIIVFILLTVYIGVLNNVESIHSDQVSLLNANLYLIMHDLSFEILVNIFVFHANVGQKHKFLALMSYVILFIPNSKQEN